MRIGKYSYLLFCKSLKFLTSWFNHWSGLIWFKNQHHQIFNSKIVDSKILSRKVRLENFKIFELKISNCRNKLEIINEQDYFWMISVLMVNTCKYPLYMNSTLRYIDPLFVQLVVRSRPPKPINRMLNFAWIQHSRWSVSQFDPKQSAFQYCWINSKCDPKVLSQNISRTSTPSGSVYFLKLVLRRL